MKLRFKETVQDKYTSQYYYKDNVYEFEDARAKDILSANNGRYAEEYKEEPKPQAEEPKQVENVALKATPALEAVKVEDLTLAELKACAKDLGLSTRGNKADLIKRITEVN